MSEHQENDHEGAELVAYQPPARTVDLRNQATDSWTDVLQDVSLLARGIANTEFVPKGLRGSIEKTSAAILYSRELGLEPMTGLGSVHVIEGKAGISAEMMRALVLRAGHELVVKRSDRTACEIWGRRKGTEEWIRGAFTIEEANQTQVFISKEKGWGPLASKAQWRSWPTEMLLARATTRLVRMIFPDVAHGMRTTEELQDMATVEAVDAEVVAGPPVVEPVQRRRAPRPRPRAASPAPAEKTTPASVASSGPASDPVEKPEPESAPVAAEAPAPVQRQRAARPAPRATKPALAEPEAPAETPPQVDALPDADGVVDAQIVEEDAGPKRKAIQAALMHWKRLGVEDRAERLWFTGVIVGHEVTSSTELTLDEAREVVHQLERARDIDAINALVDKSKGVDRG